MERKLFYIVYGIAFLIIIITFILLRGRGISKTETMRKRKSFGVMIFGFSYLFFAALLLPNTIKLLIALGYSIMDVSAPATGHDPSGKDIFLLTLIVSTIHILPTLCIAIIGIGILRLSNRIRILMLFVNPLLIIFIANLLYSMTKPYAFSPQPSLFYKATNITALVIFISALYYFTRPKVKEQFR